VIRLPQGVSEYLTDLDVSRLAWGVAQVRGILASAPLSIDMAAKELLPGPALRDDSPELRRWIRSSAYIYSHWTGTARMGNDLQACGEDHFAECDVASIEHSAVDPRLRLRGTSNVFVADASVMPKVPNGNVHSSVTMVAYRAADLLVEGDAAP
jgi:choline dehydrogenase